MMKRARGTLLNLTWAGLLLLSGCGEVAYKTGASADALQTDQQTCKQAGAAADYKSCMKAKGWSIADLDAGPSTTYIPPKPAQHVAISAPAPMVAAETPWMKPTIEVAEPAPTATDSTTPVPVTAWVKFGGGDPKDAIASCIGTLGQAHQPDMAHKTVTVALLSCMRDQGWRGI
jgi:hypothetical protein